MPWTFKKIFDEFSWNPNIDCKVMSDLCVEYGRGYLPLELQQMLNETNGILFSFFFFFFF